MTRTGLLDTDALVAATSSSLTKKIASGSFCVSRGQRRDALIVFAPSTGVLGQTDVIAECVGDYVRNGGVDAMDEKLVVSAIVLDFAAERTVFTWKGQTEVPLGLVEDQPLIQRTLRQLEDACVARIIVVHASDQVRKVAQGLHMGTAEIFVVSDLDGADHLKAVVASSEPHSRGAVLIVAANVAFADGVIKEFISAQTSHSNRRRCVVIAAPSPLRPQASPR